ncbi:MAG: ATPase, T2SS/T4P/T4SS family [Bacteriovoracia bacterium]
MNATSLKTALGPLYNLYKDEKIYAICVDAYNEVYYYQGKGESKLLDKAFKSESGLKLQVNKMLKMVDKDSLNKDNIFFNLNDFTSVHVVFPPVSARGISITITKLPQRILSLDDLVKFKAIREDGKAIIEKLISEGKGILVAGNAGSGKTTLLNMIIASIPQPQKVVTLEKYPDLIIKRQRVARLQTKSQKNEELVELVEMAERMYPDYVILSNCEGPEVMPFLELVRNNYSGIALITGENPLDALKRLETKAVISSEGLSLEDCRYAISQAFPYLVFQERMEDGSRVLTSINEVKYENGELKLKNLYKA